MCRVVSSQWFVVSLSTELDVWDTVIARGNIRVCECVCVCGGPACGMLKYSPAMATLYSNTILRHRRSHLHILQTSPLIIITVLNQSVLCYDPGQEYAPFASIRFETKHKLPWKEPNDESD